MCVAGHIDCQCCGVLSAQLCDVTAVQPGSSNGLWLQATHHDSKCQEPLVGHCSSQQGKGDTRHIRDAHLSVCWYAMLTQRTCLMVRTVRQPHVRQCQDVDI